VSCKETAEYQAQVAPDKIRDGKSQKAEENENNKIPSYLFTSIKLAKIF
jgi:hypothetical protein